MRATLIVAAIAAACLAAGWFYLKSGAHVPAPPPPKPAQELIETERMTLYFTDDESDELKAEQRQVPRPDGGAGGRVKAAVVELLKGPAVHGLSPTLPPGTRLLGARIEGGTAILDFSGEIIKNHPGGADAEMATVFSVVNTVCENVTGVTSVRILVEGAAQETLAGHVDISAPLGAIKETGEK